MDTALAVAALTAAVTALGWLVNSALTVRRDRGAREVAALLAHTERQLERLYGPLEFLLVEGRQVFEDLLHDLGRPVVFPPAGVLTPDDLRRWLFYLEHSALPRNERIVEARPPSLAGRRRRVRVALADQLADGVRAGCA